LLGPGRLGLDLPAASIEASPKRPQRKDVIRVGFRQILIPRQSSAFGASERATRNARVAICCVLARTKCDVARGKALECTVRQAEAETSVRIEFLGIALYWNASGMEDYRVA